MPTKSRQWRVVKRFDFRPRPGVVMAFKEGEVRRGLTRACVAYGEAREALQLVEESNDGETDNV